MLIGGIDFECTGLSPIMDRVIEAALVIYDTEDGFLFPKQTVASLVYQEGYPPITAEIEDLTGITQAMLDSKFSKEPYLVFGEIVSALAEHKVDVLMAHNAAFDKSFLDAELARLQVGVNLPWICTMNDIAHPKRWKCRKLSHLAFEYGVEFDNKSLHRADADVKLMFDMVLASGTDFDYLYRRALIPNVTVRALIPSPFGANGDGGVGKDAAAKCGFRWQADQKIWTKTIKEDEIEKTKQELRYNVAII